MTYRVILTYNGKYKKTLHKSKTRETAFINFYTIKDDNKVMFPKKFLNSYKIKPVKYQICVIKETEEGDTFRVLRDDYGKLYTEKPLGDWTILTSDEWLVEETFTMYQGEDKHVGINIVDIMKRLMINAHSKKMVKQIIVVHNKLIIHNEDQFDMVLCKNLEDAQRLHHSLGKTAKKQKIKSLMFMGTASPATISKMYDMIHDELGWPYTKIRRTSTRP
jgi:hypothetical protein